LRWLEAVCCSFASASDREQNKTRGLARRVLKD